MLGYITIGFKGTQSYHFSLFFTGSVIHITFPPVTVGIADINLNISE